MKYIVLCYSDTFSQPKIFLKAPESVKNEDIKQIPMLMDIYEHGFFKHMFTNIKTANLLFEIDSEYSRNKKEKLLISIAIDNRHNLTTHLAQSLLNKFATEFNKIQDVYKAFYVDSKVHKGDPQKIAEIRNLLDNFFQAFPDEEVIFEQKEAKILVFGLYLAGKTTIIRCRRKSISKNIFPTISVDISRILVNNVSLLTYDTPGQTKFRELWKPYLKNQDGLVFVLDVTDTMKYSDARALLHEVANKPELKDVPLVILFNKVDLFEPHIEELVNIMRLSELGERPLKYFFTSGIRNINIDEAFSWLSLKIAERVESVIKSDIGFIFSKWDENIGVKPISVYPTNAFEDPEIVTVRCFAISQFIFGGEGFKRATVSLPFPHLNSNATIFFDSILDETVRGGALPLALIVYYNNTIPKVVLDQFNQLILESLSTLKENYNDDEKVLNVLTEVHSKIIHQIESFKPSLKALKTAELRYEALFKAAKDAILIVDKNSGLILDANKQAENLFQLPFEDFIGLHSSQLLTDDIKVDFKVKIFEQIDQITPLFLSIINTSGYIIPVEISVNEVQIGSQFLIQCIIRDISKRVLAEQRLSDSEVKYRHLFEESPFSVLLINPKGYVVDCNPAFEKSLGYSRAELVGKRFIDLSIIDESFMMDILKQFKREYDVIYPPKELKLSRKDGKVIWASFRSSYVKIGDENFYQIIGHDISSRKIAEEDLQKTLKLQAIIARIASRFVVLKDINSAIEDSLREIGDYINAARGYIYIIDEKYLFMEKSYQWYKKVVFPIVELPETFDTQQFDWLCKQLINRDYLYIENVSQLPEEAKVLKLFLETQNIKGYLTFPIKMENSLIGIISFDFVKKSEGWKEETYATLSIFSDILKSGMIRKYTEEKLRKSEEQSHKEFDREYFRRELFVNDIDKLIGSILSTINSFSAEHKEDINDAENELFKSIKTQCFEAGQLVSTIRKLTQLEEGKISIKKTDIKTVIDNAIDIVVESYSGKKINIIIESPTENIFVLADKYLIDVFTNILMSLIKYNRNPDIEIRINIQAVERKEQNYIRVEFIEEKSNFSYLEKGKILDKDFKDSKIKEILLGFILVERILKNYEGLIWVEGNDFVVFIPKAE